MSTTTMHFGPEWMRAKQQPQARPQAPPSPPPASNLQSATSTYSALVSAIPTTQNDKQDEVHPFRYSKEELLKIYKESPKGSLGLEVERWEGVVREIGSDPVGLREMGEAEKKLFAGPLNSDLRRRQSTDILSPLITSGTERTRLGHNSPSATGSPLRERYTGLKRRDSNTDSPNPTLARKTSLSALQSPSISSRTPGLPSPRIRQGFNGGAFDGVLGETWTSRRRISEASRPGAISRDSSGGLSIDNGDKGTVQGDGREVGDAGVNQGRGTPSQIEAPSTPDSSGRRQSSGVNTPNGSVGAPNAAGGGLSGPADPKDLPAVEWTYKDPSGNVQGPFRADLMQKWYDDGYFESVLPMKRVQYDAEWITVGEIEKRATLEKIFLSPLRPVGPPGLTKRDSPSLHQAGENVFNNPYQPAPIRSLRSSTLDTFNGSNPSDSPSSSLGHFGNNSPDPVAYPGLAGNGHGYVGGDGNAMLGFGGGMDVNGIRRSHFQDYHDPNRLHSPSYGNIMGNQGFINNGHLFSGQFNTVQTSPWGTPSHDAYSAYGTATYGAGAFAPHSPFNGQLPNQVIGGQINPLLYGGNDLNHLNTSNQFNNHLAPNNVGNEQHFGNNPQAYGVQQYQTPSTNATDNQTDYALQQETQGTAPVAWDSAPSALPNSINTSVPTSSSQTSPWGEPQEPAQATEQVTISKDASPWVLASKGVLESPWGQPQEEGAPANTKLEKLDEEPIEPQEPVAAPEPSAPATAPSPTTEVSQAPAPKGKKNKTASSGSVSTPAPAPVPVPADSPTPSPATPATPAQKAPWAKDDKKKAKAAGTAISLREIQDAEAKAAEARKAKEEKERASRLAASVSVESREDVQPFTASWGLPTSQAGGRTSSYAKDAPPAPAPAASTPVWTNAPKPVVKKTMKEIQEEEERRKKAAAKETAASTAAKRVYAESTAKATTAAAPPSNSAWVTVGASGKTGAAATPSRPAAAVVASSPQVRSNGPTAVRPAVQASASKPTASPGGKVEDFPVSPSHEFLKWLTESLKGLNSSVNVEEIISMLLSFSLDPDPITIEIIQETIYANSTTLDGRRFAADFVAKRKADAASRRSGAAAGKAASKPVSIAEVVKATPKASQPEWGGFKVVNKKKKGGRA